MKYWCRHRLSPFIAALLLGTSTMWVPTADGGVAITPDDARALYERIVALREPDGCRLTRFDTKADAITISLQSEGGAEYGLELATEAMRANAVRVGQWSVAANDGLDSHCGATFRAIRAVLEGAGAPTGDTSARRESDLLQVTYELLAASFVVLVLGTAYILYRELRINRPPPAAIVTLAAIWAGALVIRLEISPRTFLHEYFHVAEAVAEGMGGYAAPGYGQTGPSLFALMRAITGRRDDVQLIFLTNAVVASLAIPAVAALDLSLVGSWPHAVAAAVLLSVLPQHVRYSAAEDMFIQAVTFALWALALWALYMRRRDLEVGIVAAVALSIAVQTRPEMLLFPAAVLAMIVLVQPRPWQVLADWRTIISALLAGALLIPRAIDMGQVMGTGSTPSLALPEWRQYVDNLILFNRDVTPPVVWIFLAAGVLWTAWRKPGVLVWVALVYTGWTFFSRLTGGNLLYDIRSQLLPTSFVVLIAAGAASLWIEAWRPRRRRAAVALGAVALLAAALTMIVPYRGFVTELRDQQLEWAFLERTVRQLPERGTLLSAIRIGGPELDAFPQFLLQRDGKHYRLVDLRDVAEGAVSWPSPGNDLIYYQGMFCHYAFPESEPMPDPIAARCRAVHDRYVTEPLFIEDLDTTGYSMLRYANGGQGPFRIGFYRLAAARPVSDARR